MYEHMYARVCTYMQTNTTKFTGPTGAAAPVLNCIGMFSRCAQEIGASPLKRMLVPNLVWAETCPQYLFLTRDELDKPGMEGSKFICSPPLRDAPTQKALWQHVQAGSLSLVSSDHAPYRYDNTGKFNAGYDVNFRQIANGMPGIEMRLPLLFSEGVNKGRISLNKFVALSSTNAARIYGISITLGNLYLIKR